MNLAVSRHANQAGPMAAGRRAGHILAQFDATSIVVYQAYRPAIGHYAAEHGHFGGPEFGSAA